MRLRTWTSVVAAVFLVTNLGCGWLGDSGPSGGVAVVDLDEIAKQVGADDEIATAIKLYEANLNSQLQGMRTGYVQQLKERKEQIGENPTEEQSKQLASINRQININLVSAQQQANSHLSSQRGTLIMQFRTKVAPAAEEIARNKGLSIVVPKNEGWLLAVDERVDITNEVAAALKQSWQPLVVKQPNTTVEHRISPEAADPRIAGPANSGISGEVQPASHWETQQPTQPLTP